MKKEIEDIFTGATMLFLKVIFYLNIGIKQIPP